MSFTRDMASAWSHNGSNGARRQLRLPRRYSAWSLLRHGLTGEDWPRAWRTHDLKESYDVVIIGAGVHGLAAAYYLARNHGITNVAVLDRGYMGGGNSGRNTAIVRSNYLTPEGVRFYNRSVKLYEELTSELNFNVMFSQSGHLTLAHTDSSLRTMRWRAEVNKLDSRSALPRAGRDHSSRCSQLGLCERSRRGRHPHPSENRSDRNRRRE
jgi:sarcosine oxidase subunit beta